MKLNEILQPPAGKVIRGFQQIVHASAEANTNAAIVTKIISPSFDPTSQDSMNSFYQGIGFSLKKDNSKIYSTMIIADRTKNSYDACMDIILDKKNMSLNNDNFVLSGDYIKSLKHDECVGMLLGQFFSVSHANSSFFVQDHKPVGFYAKMLIGDSIAWMKFEMKSNLDLEVY